MKLKKLKYGITCYSIHASEYGSEDPDTDLRAACDELLALYDHACSVRCTDAGLPDAARKVFVDSLTEAASYASWEADSAEPKSKFAVKVKCMYEQTRYVHANDAAGALDIARADVAKGVEADVDGTEDMDWRRADVQKVVV